MLYQRRSTEEHHLNVQELGQMHTHSLGQHMPEHTDFSGY